jgi:hypothetical protein
MWLLIYDVLVDILFVSGHLVCVGEELFDVGSLIVEFIGFHDMYSTNRASDSFQVPAMLLRATCR